MNDEQATRETTAWYEWEEEKPKGQAVLTYERNGKGVQKRAELVSGSTGARTTVLLRMKGGDRLEVRNDGPEVVTLEAVNTQTEQHCGRLWEVEESAPLGSLRAGQTERWTCKEETVTAILRTECFARPRGEYLVEAGRGGGRRGSIAEAVMTTVLREAGARTVRRGGNGSGVYDVELAGQRSVWVGISAGDERRFRECDWYCKYTDKPLTQSMKEAASLLKKDSEAGTPTVLMLMSGRAREPHGVTEEEVAELLFGEPITGTGEKEGAKVGRAGRDDAEHLKDISVIATMSVEDIIPKQIERGIPGSRLARNTEVLYTTRMYRNPWARATAERSTFTRVRTSWHVRREAAPRRPYGIVNEVVHPWDEWCVDIRERERARRRWIPGKLLKDHGAGCDDYDRDRQIRQGIRLHDRARPGWSDAPTSGRGFARRTVLADSHEEWLEYVYERGATDRTARITGCDATVAEVLERLVNGEKMSSVGRTTPVAPGGRRLEEELAAVFIASTWALELAGEVDTRPDSGDGVELTLGICFGHPRLEDTRIRVRGILEGMLWGGEIETVAKGEATNREGVLTALRYGLRAVRKQQARRQEYAE